MRSLVDPGNWLLWVRENVPPRLVQVASDLCIFGATTDSDQFQKLIRFHDKKRRFPRSALLTDPGALERALQTRITSPDCWGPVGKLNRLPAVGLRSRRAFCELRCGKAYPNPLQCADGRR